MEHLDKIISKQTDKMTAIEYVIWRIWLTSNNNNPKGDGNQKTIYDAQQAAAELARLQQIEAIAILCVDRWNECETDTLLDTDMPKLAAALKGS